MKQIYLYMMMIVMVMILLLISLFMSVAFLTLMERKFLGYIQIRKGPNKLGFMGILQPFSDAIKLIIKELYLINKLNYMIYLISPMFSLMLIFMMWMIYPIYSNFLSLSLGLMYLMCCLSLGGYSLMMSGWSSNSSYSMLGSIRSLAQSISYEVSLSIILIIPLFMINYMDFMNLITYNINYMFFILMWPLSILFLLSMMAELNRTPFDFSEGESELVSGFNVEYMSSGFIMIFLSEYASIIFLSFIYVLFFGGGFYNLVFYMKIMIIMFLIIWIRGTMPRFRYDLLMYLCWLMILPFSLNYMIYMIFLKIMFLS